MTISKISSHLAVGIIASIVSVSAANAKVCNNNYCASSSDNGRTISVNLTSKKTNATHYNVKIFGKEQFESSGRFTIAGTKGGTSYYSVQICTRGSGVFSKSNCGPWKTYNHPVN